MGSNIGVAVSRLLRRSSWSNPCSIFIGCLLAFADSIRIALASVVKDRRVLGLLRGWQAAGVMEEGKLRYEISERD
jgi:hypothetical protein